MTVKVGQYWRYKPNVDDYGFLIESDWYLIRDVSVDGKNGKVGT